MYLTVLAFPKVTEECLKDSNYISSVVISDGEKMTVTSPVCKAPLEGVTSKTRESISPCPSAGLIRLCNRIGNESRISLLDRLCMNNIRWAIHPSSLNKLHLTRWPKSN